MYNWAITEEKENYALAYRLGRTGYSWQDTIARYPSADYEGWEEGHNEFLQKKGSVE